MEVIVMTYQELLNDLSIAERNSSTKIWHGRLRFSNEVTKVFGDKNINSFIDLIQLDLNGALKLRRMAVREKLLKRASYK
jgi:hypothetical protein